MDIRPSLVNWAPAFYEKISNMPEKNSSFLPRSREETIKYLKWWSLTQMNSACTVDVIDYEELIYFELKYKEDREIQNLIQILKEKITRYYDLKSKWLDLLIDSSIYNKEDYEMSRQAIESGLYSFMDEDF